MSNRAQIAYAHAVETIRLLLIDLAMETEAET